MRIALLPVRGGEADLTHLAATDAHEGRASDDCGDGVAGCSSIELKRSFGFDFGFVGASVVQNFGTSARELACRCIGLRGLWLRHSSQMSELERCWQPVGALRPVHDFAMSEKRDGGA